MNVLAVEIRASDVHPVALAGRKNWKTPHQGDVSWSHGQLWAMEVRSAGGVPSVLTRPEGVRVWAEDMHRIIISSEFLAEGVSPAPLRFVGAPNGSFSGQIVVSTDRALTGLKATPGKLASADGAVIPAGALKAFAMTPHRLDEWRTLGWGRGGMPHCTNPLVTPASMALVRHGPRGTAGMTRERRIEELKKLSFFDHVAAGPQAPLPAGTSRPIWVTLRVPADAKGGTYRGRIRIEAAGMKPASVPVEAEIHGWRVPGPRGFQANAALEQSPYGVAKQYGARLWSDEHFRLMEASFRQLGRIGNDWVNIPIISLTEFGNMRDSMVRWIRRRDGTLAFDYAALDRYLDLAVRRLGKPRVINFIVMQGCGENRWSDVDILDEATGRRTTKNLYHTADDFADLWRRFARSLYGHMRSRGLERSMHWGFLWDSVGDSELPGVLASATPEVGWTSAAHRGKERFYVKAYSQLLPFRLTEKSMMGWRKKEFHVLLPRGGGSLIAGPGVAFPFNFRLMVDRALVVGMNGVGRMGADYWGDTYIKGVRAEGFLRAGMPNHFMLWPGPDGAEPSARFMALIEGFQEAEARIFLEQQLVRKVLPEKLANKVREVLYEHHRGTLFIPSMNAAHTRAELCRDWQD
ncbi:hypothetical protein LCGC14_2113150, partial [marine sediment metagenome]